MDDEQCVSLSQGRGSAEAEILRLTSDEAHEDIFGLAHPAKSGVLVDSASRAHASDLAEDPRDEDQPGKGGEVHRKVRELIERHPDLFTDGKGREGARSGSKSYPAKSPAEREREERRAQGRHAGAFSIEDLGRKRRYGTNVAHPALKPGRVTPS